MEHNQPRAIDDYWYKNAVVYCLNVATYMDCNGDGIADFEGLSRRPGLPARARRGLRVAAALLLLAQRRQRLRRIDADAPPVLVLRRHPPRRRRRAGERLIREEQGPVTRMKTSGLGLGLYIAQAIAEAHGGSIEVDSSAERGITFTVSLPRETTGAASRG